MKPISCLLFALIFNLSAFASGSNLKIEFPLPPESFSGVVKYYRGGLFFEEESIMRIKADCQYPRPAESECYMNFYNRSLSKAKHYERNLSKVGFMKISKEQYNILRAAAMKECAYSAQFVVEGLEIVDVDIDLKCDPLN